MLDLQFIIGGTRPGCVADQVISPHTSTTDNSCPEQERIR
jgi:hypothetical protein